MTRKERTQLIIQIRDSISKKDYKNIDNLLNDLSHGNVLMGITLLRYSYFDNKSFEKSWSKQLEYTKELCKKEGLNYKNVLQGLLK